MFHDGVQDAVVEQFANLEASIERKLQKVVEATATANAAGEAALSAAGGMQPFSSEPSPFYSGRRPPPPTHTPTHHTPHTRALGTGRASMHRMMRIGR